MQNQNQNQIPVVVIGGIQYDASAATETSAALIQDLTSIQAELNRHKLSFDIATIARNAVLGSLSSVVESGESGLVELVTDEEVQEAAAEATQTTEA